VVSLRAIKAMFGAGSGERWRPEASVVLTRGEGLTLEEEAGDGDLIVKRLALLPGDTWTKNQYWAGTFRVTLANPPRNGGAEPDTRFDVEIGGRQEPVDILRGLASHINQRSSYGARVRDGILEIIGPTNVKTGEGRELGVERVFGDAFIRPAV
jgi:hypothetical protein